MIIDYFNRQITFKIVLGGPTGAGKRTYANNLLEAVPEPHRGHKFVAGGGSDGPVTMSFDCHLPTGKKLRGFAVHLKFITAPADKIFHESRRILLDGTDGLFFLVDPQQTPLVNEDNWRLIQGVLTAQRIGPMDLPTVMVFNKSDLQASLLAEAAGRVFSPITSPVARGQAVREIPSFSISARTGDNALSPLFYLLKEMLFREPKLWTQDEVDNLTGRIADPDRIPLLIGSGQIES